MANRLNILIIFIVGYSSGVNGKNAIVRVNDSSDFPPANLSCPDGHMIHVQSIRYYDDVNNQTCGQPVDESSMGLTTECNGNRTCNCIVPSRSSCPNVSAADVNYRCVNSMDVLYICDNIQWSTSKIRKTVFLASPNYPERAFFNTRTSPCSCSITGFNITSIQVLELILKGGIEKAILTIKYGDKTYNKSSYTLIYNFHLQMSTINTSLITLNHHKFPNSKLWVEFIGESLAAQCTNTTYKVPASSTKPTISSTINEISTNESLASSSTFTNNRPLVTQIMSTTSELPVSTDRLSSISTSNGTSWMDHEILPANTGSTLSFIIALPIVGVVLVAVIIIISCRTKKRKATKLPHETEENQNTQTQLLKPSTANISHPAEDRNSQPEIIVNENTAYVSYEPSSACNVSSQEIVEILENTIYSTFEQDKSRN